MTSQDSFEVERAVRLLYKYEVQERIGWGGMGHFYKANLRKSKRDVTIKFWKFVPTVQSVQRFYTSSIFLHPPHPNIVTIYDVDECMGAKFLVMEYVDGVDLATLVRKNGPLPVDKAVNCVLQTARGLEYAHQHGILHRTLKPHNLILDVSGTVKILDLGLDRFEDLPHVEKESTISEPALDTLDYISPELATDQKRADYGADIYSLGCTLFYLLGAKPIYGGETPMQKIMAHRNQPIPPLTDACSTVPKALDFVYRRMVAKNVKVRYPNMGEVIVALESC